MSNLYHGPKVRTLTSNETISSLETWKSTVIYGLRLNPDFREFLVEDFVFGTKSKANPTRSLLDTFTKETVSETFEGKTTTKEVMVLRKSKEDRVYEVDLLLDQICNYCPNIPRNDLTKDCASLSEVWQKIRQYYNKQQTGALLNETWNVQREPEETPQALFARMK